MPAYRNRTPLVLGGTAEHASVNLKTTAHAVARAAPPPDIRPDTSAISGALNRFFGATLGFADTLQRADIEAARIEERKAIEDRATQGRADAEAGRPMADDMSGFRSYYQTYSSVSGARRGAEMVDELRAGIANLPPDANLDEYSDNFLRNATANMPRDNPYFQAEALSRYNSGLEQVRNQRRQDTIRQTLAANEQDWSNDLGSRLNSGDEIDIQRETERYRILNPREAHLAPQRVMQTLLASAGSSPEAVDRVLSIMRRPGSGTDGRSFAESFPVAFDGLQQEATQRVGAVRTRAAQEGYATLNQRLQDARTVEDFQGILTDANTLFRREGGLNAFQSLRGHIGTAMNRLATTTARANADNTIVNNAIITRGANVDVSAVRAALPGFRERQGIDIFDTAAVGPDGPREPGFSRAARLVDATGVVDDDLKHSLSVALTDPTNPERQAAAFQMVRASTRNGRVTPSDMLNSHAASWYAYANSRSPEGSGGNLTLMFTNMGEAMRASPASRTLPTYQQLAGASNEAAGRTTIEGKITESLRSRLGAAPGLGSWVGMDSTVAVPPALHARLGDDIRREYDYQSRLGAPDINTVVNTVIERHRNNIALLPGRDGSYVVSYSEAPITGVPASRAASNTFTEQPEDTTATAQADLQRMSADLPAFGPLHLMLNPANTPGDGVYTVVRANGAPVTFAPGQTIRIMRRGMVQPPDENRRGRMFFGPTPENPFADGATPIDSVEKFTLPADLAAAQRAFSEQFPDSPFELIPVETQYGDGFQLGYRFRWTTANSHEEARQLRDAAQRQRESVDNRRQHRTRIQMRTRAGLPVTPSLEP